MQYTALLMGKNKQLIASLVYSDPDTGEQQGKAKGWLEKKPEIISFAKDFAKIHYKELSKMSNSQRGRFVLLFNHLEYRTNRLVDKGLGYFPIALDQDSISHIIGLRPRQTNTFVGEMKNINAILRIDSAYHMSPRFGSRSKGIAVEIVEKMIKIDPLIVKAISEKEWDRLKNFI